MQLVRRSGQISFAVFLAFGMSAFAQPAQPAPTLDQILTRIEANTESYKASVPSFVCDEHIISQEIRDGKVKHTTTVDAVFSVSRSKAQAGVLNESRDITSVDGKPSSNSKAKMPLTFSGGFSGALTKFLSADHRACFNYQEDASTASPAGTASFTFIARDTALKEPACASIQQGTTGKFVVDLASMQVTHIERTVPTLVNKDQNVLGTASVDYSAIVLNGNTFWLPATITASTSQTPKTNGSRFTARYGNYHRYTSTATVVSATTDSNQLPPSQ